MNRTTVGGLKKILAGFKDDEEIVIKSNDYASDFESCIITAERKIVTKDFLQNPDYYYWNDVEENIFEYPETKIQNVVYLEFEGQE